MLKKLTSCVLAALCAASMLGTTVSAAETQTLTVYQNSKADVGSTLSVTVSTSDVQEFAGITLKVTYDKNAYHLTGYTLPDTSIFKTDSAGFVFPAASAITAYEGGTGADALRIYYGGIENQKISGGLITLNFEVLQGYTASTAKVSVECDEKVTVNPGYFDNNGDPQPIGSSTEYKDCVLGDANGDGKVSGLDLVRLRNYILGRTTDINAGADINGDGKYSGMDLLRLKKILMDK